MSIRFQYIVNRLIQKFVKIWFTVYKCSQSNLNIHFRSGIQENTKCKAAIIPQMSGTNPRAQRSPAARAAPPAHHYSVALLIIKRLRFYLEPLKEFCCFALHTSLHFAWFARTVNVCNKNETVRDHLDNNWLKWRIRLSNYIYSTSTGLVYVWIPLIINNKRNNKSVKLLDKLESCTKYLAAQNGVPKENLENLVSPFRRLRWSCVPTVTCFPDTPFQ